MKTKFRYNLKKGLISIEYVILLSIIVIFAIALYLTSFKENTVNVADKSNQQLNHVLAADEGGGSVSDDSDVDYSDGDDGMIYPGSDEWNAVSDFTFSATASGVTINSYKGTSKKVVVPEVINELPVIKINDNAFNGKELTSVKLPSTIKEIGPSAFKANHLSVFVAPSELQKIGDMAFMGNQLTAVAFNSKLKTIGISAFMGNKISSIDTRLVSTIGSKAFYDNELANIQIGASLTSLSTNAFMEQGGLNGKAGIVSISGDEKRFNSIWDETFDSKFNGSKPN